MSIEQITMFRLACDDCGAHFEFDDGILLYDTRDQFLGLFEDPDEMWGWTTDGEGHYHCAECEPLTMTETALADLARKITPADVPLIEVPR